MELIKATSLETTPNVIETLEWKINSLIEQDKNVSNGLADYFGIGLGNIDAQLAQLDELSKEISDRKKALKAQITTIKEEGAHFLEMQGIDKLDGVLTSSVTITKGKPESTKTKFKLLVDKKESEEFLVNSGLAVYEVVDVPATKDTIRVNKRKIALSEVVDADDKLSV
jgi:hypothetical protein